MKYIIYNKHYFLHEDFKLSIENRAFNYGDALFETLRACANYIYFFENHLNRLKQGMKLLKMNIPEDFENGILEKQIKKLLLKNKLFKGIRIKIFVFRATGGYYTPISNEINFLITTEKLINKTYTFNKIGLRIDIFKEIYKSNNFFSNYKTANSLVFIMAGIYKTEKLLDDCILINENHNLIESISSNIFLVKDNFLFTPSLKSACVAGIMRQNIINISKDLDLKVSENLDLTEKHLQASDEIFLTNAIQGIRWVSAYKNKRYFNKTAKKIFQKLVEIQR